MRSLHLFIIISSIKLYMFIPALVSLNHFQGYRRVSKNEDSYISGFFPPFECESCEHLLFLVCILLVFFNFLSFFQNEMCQLCFSVIYKCFMPSPRIIHLICIRLHHIR